MNGELYVRLEAVNLANFVEDVHDLSTIRGGSFLLLDAVGAVERRFQLSPISSGASIGFFSLKSDEEPERVRRGIETFLHADERFQHATFVVDVRRPADFLSTREALTAMNRWRQFQQPTLAVPSPAAMPSNEECAFDHLRPAAVPTDTPDGKRNISRSVDARRTHGRVQKQAFYEAELRQLLTDTTTDEALDRLIERVASTPFANDLETLTSDESRKNLHLKMAVVYFDGNQFGSRQRDCASPAEQQRLDTTIKTCRRTVLRALLERIFASKTNGWWVPGAEGREAVRLETLLWGGDELIWVVPAWKGWEVVELFYDQSKSWQHDGEPLTHAGGIVFCHRGAPIHRMRRTAHDLAGLCKEFIAKSQPEDSHRGRDLFAYQIFESFDLIGGALETFRRQRVPLDREAHELLVRGAGMECVAEDFATVRRGFPRSKLHEIVLALRERGDNGTALISAEIAKLQPPDREALQRLFQFFGQPEPDSPWESSSTVWFHLADLWDYAIA